LAGITSALSGLVFLLPGDLSSGVLGINYQAWNAVHTWSSLAVIAGVGAHLALHWKWLVAMTKRTFLLPGGQAAGASTSNPGYGEADGKPLSRRAFLVFGGTAAVVTGVIAAGYKAFFPARSAAASQGDDQIAAQQEGGVACPFGLVNDPYPGRCRHYRDSNGDGICDYSVTGSGSNGTAGGDGSLAGEFSGQNRESGGHRSGFGRP